MAHSLFSESDSDSDLEVLALLTDWDISSDSEADQPVRPPCKRRFKRVNYMQSLEDAEFTYNFRLTKSAVNYLLHEINPFVRVTSSRNHGVPPLHQLLVTLRFYALGTMLVSIAEFVGVSRSTASRIIRDISIAIASLYDKFIFVHHQSALKFYDISGFPRVLGVLDCTHIRVHFSRLSLKEYRNREGYYSMNVQAVCDADLRFMNMVASWPGSTADVTIFNNSILKVQCEAGENKGRCLLGDGAYPNTSYLLTPVLNPRTDAEQKYNEAHLQTRNTIERAFDVWKRRFPVMTATLRVSLPVVQAIIVSTAVLHNICIDNDIEEVPPEVELEVSNSSHDTIDNMEVEDLQTRTDLINNFFIE